MQTADLFNFGSGGSFYGDGKRCRWDNWRFSEHAFESHDKQTGAVTARYTPQCMLGVDVYQVEDREPEDPEFVTQWYPVGNLSNKRLVELGLAADPKNFGGYRPSADGENGSEEGPFVVLDGSSNIWSGSTFALLQGELMNLGFSEHQERAAAEGIACLNGLVAVGGMKVKPKGKKAQQEEALTGQSKQDKKILVPVEIIHWPWDEAKDQTARTAPAAPAAQKKAGAAPATAPAAPATSGNGKDASATAASSDADVDAKLVAIVQKALSEKGGEIEMKALPGAVLKHIVKEGKNRDPFLKRMTSPDFLKAGSDAGAWAFDEASGLLVGA